MATVLIGCKLPHGLTITHPVSKEKVSIEGLNKTRVIGATYATTPVDADFWASWKKVYSDYAPLKNGAIFEATSGKEAKEKAEDLSKEKTGFEPMPKEDGKIKKADK